MKKQFLIALAMIASFGSTLAAVPTPVQKARAHLEHALSLLANREARADGKGNDAGARYPGVVTALSDAEVSLSEVKANKGTNTNVALKSIAEAKTELDVAKDGAGDHVQKARAAIEEALKHVMRSIAINHHYY